MFLQQFLKCSPSYFPRLFDSMLPLHKPLSQYNDVIHQRNVLFYFFRAHAQANHKSLSSFDDILNKKLKKYFKTKLSKLSNAIMFNLLYRMIDTKQFLYLCSETRNVGNEEDPHHRTNNVNGLIECIRMVGKFTFEFVRKQIFVFVRVRTIM